MSRLLVFILFLLCLLAKVIVSCADKLVDEGRTFDAVLALELPKGCTHQWSSFLTPEELTMILQRTSLDVKEMAGFVYNPITGRRLLSDDIGVNFIAYGTKKE
ncbi:unnamed protein product [Brassica rapa]|uniref:Uncharacterized protein n=1 Tax=Brassica campestris TaxID=3711 RepID=A0A8D9DCW7_BRACM|nr:unnamed protein product [Brassica rapa]